MGDYFNASQELQKNADQSRCIQRPLGLDDE